MLQKDRAVLETAIKSLELALHPNTADQELLAGIMGFRAKARGRPLSEIAQSLYGSRYDGRTLPEYRAEWESRFDEQARVIHTLNAQVRDLHRAKEALKILLAKSVANEQNAVGARLRAETKLKEAQDEVKRMDRASRAMVRVSARVKKQPEAPQREPRGSCPSPVVWNSKANDIAPPRSKTPIAWTPELYQTVFKMLRERKSSAEIKKVCGLDPANRGKGAIDRKFTNDGPDENLLGFNIVVRNSGSMDYVELWKIGHALWAADRGRKDTWKGFVCQKYLDRSSRAIQWDDPTWLSEEQRDRLRAEYRALRAGE